MPIQLLGGPPRSGKSHYGVKYRLMHFLRRGVITVTDIAGLDPSGIAAYLKISLDELNKLLIIKTPEDVQRLLKEKKFLYHPTLCPDAVVQPGYHLALDEAWRYWPAGQALNEIEAEFFPYHGHYTDPATHNAIEITLLTQSKAQLTKQLHPLIEAQYIFRKMKITGRSDTFQVFVYDGNNRRATTNYKEKYDPVIFPLYKSANSGGVTDDADKRRSIYNTPLFKYGKIFGLPAMLLCLYLAYTSLNKLAHPQGAPSAPPVASTPAAASSAIPSTPGAVAPAAAPAAPASSAQPWRVVASYKRGELPVFIVVDESGRYRTLTPGAYSVGAGGEVYLTIAPDDNRATPWTNKAPTYVSYTNSGTRPTASAIPK